MNETTLPPSPNWYLSNILACSFNGTVAWGARDMIVVAKSEGNGKALQYSIIKHSHKSKVTCLAFTPEFEEINLLASAGNDNAIKIWNLETLTIAYTHLLEADKQVISVDWSHKDAYVIYAAISNGCVLSWNAHFDIVSSISLGKMTPTCISSCPHDPHLVAVGSKSGLVYIINFQFKGQVVYKLRGHDTEIVSLSWCPSKINVLSGNLKEDLLLASGGKDRSVFIWKTGGDGRYEMTISLPGGPLDSHQHRSKLNPSVGNWVVVHWIEPKLLLTSSQWGELISWNLSTMIKGKPTVKLIHANHNRGLFCIASVPNIEKTSEEDWRLKQRHTIWTLAQDRKIICCGIKENNVEIDYDIFTQSGYVYCISACPLDTSQVAFGVGDAMLRLWNLSEPHCTSFDITVLWQKIKGKIRAISWHPEKENLLAYATEEGRVGVFNTNGNKPPTLYRQYHRNTVYTIGWGPNPDNKHVVYSCGEEELVYYDSVESSEYISILPNTVCKSGCTEFSWKPDFSCLAVGCENGIVLFLNRKLQPLGSARLASNMVHCLVWHPESTATDLTFSPFKDYLAVATKSPTVVIYDLHSFISTLNDSIDENSLKTGYDNSIGHTIVATLTGHVHSVVCLAWSPYISGHLISGSYDGTAQVWNIETQELIVTYKGHSGPVQSGTTSKEMKKKTSERTSYFAKSNNAANEKVPLLNSLLNIIKSMKSENVSSDESQNTSYHMIPILFSTQDSFMSFLSNEKCYHNEKSKYDVITEIDLWCDNFKQNLEEAAKKKRLNDFLVSLSASLSMKTWKDMCELYAHQLIIEGNPYKAVSYLLCIHKTYKAIEVFQDANLYKEAYVLARCKLESDDPVLTNVLRHWAKYTVNTGNFEEAAYIYAKLGEFSDTIKYLARRKDVSTLMTAAEIALLCNNDTLGKSLAEQTIVTALTNSEYNLVRTIIIKFPFLKYQEIHLLTLEEFEKIIKKNVNVDMIQTWVNGKSNYGLLQALETICGDCSPHYTDLCQSNFCNTLENKKMLCLSISHEFALATASSEKEQKLKHIVNALHTITQFETLHPEEFQNGSSLLYKIIIQLDSKNLTNERSIFAKTDYPVSTSLRAYLCYALLKWLVCNLDEEPVSNDIQTYISLMEHLLEDALNKRTVKYWSITYEINKLGNQIASVTNKTQEEDKNDQHIESLMKELNALNSEKKQLLNELVYVPNPLMVYSKANELSCKLLDITIQTKLSKIISTTWTNATT
ncbi:PREDICTED: gem-associated protein 5 [Habropoda laboriosa]|uniref:gem-associated protein 5 n=1 Tax=Habropoda laboriosa TaxID=597456 RepID=UPI00083DAE58|nr:PREDICTED: gem-associated protein 5 [Habropoda laboriosa]